MSESEDTDIIPSPTSIVRAPTDITSVNSSLARPAIPSQDSLAKVTYYKLDLDTILDGLIPDPLPESGGEEFQWTVGEDEEDRLLAGQMVRHSRRTLQAWHAPRACGHGRRTPSLLWRRYRFAGRRRPFACQKHWNAWHV